MKKNKKILGVIFVLVLWCVIMVGGLAFAQEKFPTKPVTMIIPTAPGGGQDLTARALQTQLEKALGQPVTIVNKEGAGNSIGMNYLEKTSPDGYTIGQASPCLITTKYSMKSGNDYLKFEPIAYGGYSPGVLLVRNEAPWKTIKEFLDYCKANPGKVTVGNAGFGSVSYMLGFSIEHAAGVKFIHVPFKGTAPASMAVLGGHVDAMGGWITDTLHLIKGNKLRCLAVTAPERS